MFNLKDPEIYFALQTVQRAARLVKEVQRELGAAAHFKQDRSPVTVGDFAVQAFVGQRLEKKFPGDVLVAEESADMLRAPEGGPILSQVSEYVNRFLPEASTKQICDWIDLGKAEPKERFWTLDPIDGTRGFLRGEQYVVALALIEKGEVKLGVIACPNLREARYPDIGGKGSLVLGVKNGGAWQMALEDEISETSFHTIKVSSVSDPRQASILSSVESGHTNVTELEDLIQALAIQNPPQLMDSQAKHVALAAGGGELFFRFLSSKKPDYREKIWDQAAGAIIIEEAGGKVTDLEGSPFNFSLGRTLAQNRGVVASNGHLHPAVIEALRVARLKTIF